MSKDNFTPITTPIGDLRYPKLSEPDTKGEYADGKYKTEITFNTINTALVKKEMEACAARMFPGAKNVKIPMKTAKDGTVSFIFKSKNKPMLVDAKKQKIPAGVNIGGGSTGRVHGSLAKYEKGPNKGITAYLSAVQVIELQEGGGSISAFDVEDGFEAPAGTEAFETEGPDDQGALAL